MAHFESAITVHTRALTARDRRCWRREAVASRSDQLRHRVKRELGDAGILLAETLDAQREVRGLWRSVETNCAALPWVEGFLTG
jgi:hypothetical protein